MKKRVRLRADSIEAQLVLVAVPGSAVELPALRCDFSLISLSRWLSFFSHRFSHISLVVSHFFRSFRSHFSHFLRHRLAAAGVVCWARGLPANKRALLQRTVAGSQLLKAAFDGSAEPKEAAEETPVGENTATTFAPFLFQLTENGFSILPEGGGSKSHAMDDQHLQIASAAASSPPAGQPFVWCSFSAFCSQIPLDLWGVIY